MCNSLLLVTFSLKAAGFRLIPKHIQFFKVRLLKRPTPSRERTSIHLNAPRSGDWLTCRATSGSILLCRGQFIAANKTSPSSSLILPESPLAKASSNSCTSSFNFSRTGRFPPNRIPPVPLVFAAYVLAPSQAMLWAHHLIGFLTADSPSSRPSFFSLRAQLLLSLPNSPPPGPHLYS